MSLLDLLADIPMFQGFSDEERKHFASLDHSMLGFNAGDVIIKEGDQHACLYLLIAGSVLITKDSGGPALSKLGQGSVFGEMSFFTKRPRYTNVIASGPVKVLKIDEAFFHKLPVEMRDKIKDYFLALLIERLDNMNHALLKISRYASNNVVNT